MSSRAGLQIAPDLSLPLDAVTRTHGILAVRGAGKSNCAAVMAEEMFAAGLPFVVVDPVGAWYGLRSSSDGKSPGLPIPVFGGKHGDLPLDRHAGELVANLVVSKRLSCVLDLSTFDSENEKKAFLLAFARRLYQTNEDPLHLFLEEADDYIPQRPMRDEAVLLRAWENIVRRGRARGLGITLITQRSASLNKNVLTQVETLIVLRTTGPQDRTAIEAWVQYHQQSRDVLASLAGLEDGEAWVWSPHVLKLMRRVQVRRRRTFDSGATPRNVRGKDARPVATLADVDLSALQSEMAATIERAKADDPRELRRRIAGLERDLKAAKAERALERVEVSTPVIPQAVRDEIAIRREAARLHFLALREFIEREERSLLNGFDKELQRVLDAYSSQVSAEPCPRGSGRAPVVGGDRTPRASTRERHRGESVSCDLTGPERRILDAIAWLESIGVDTPEQTAVAFLAGYTYGGGAYNNPRGALRTRGFVEYAGSDRIRLTDQGRRLATYPEAVLTTERLHEAVLTRLPGPEQRLLRPLLDAYPKALTNEDLAHRAGYTAGAGAFNNPRGRLRSLGLVEYPQPGHVAARSILFL